MAKPLVVSNDELVIDITEDEICEELIDLGGSGDEATPATQSKEVPKPEEKNEPEEGECKEDPESVQNEYVMTLLCDFARNSKYIKECKFHYLFDDAVLSKKASVNFSSLDCSEIDVPVGLKLATKLESCVYFWNTRHQPDSCFHICAKKKPIHVIEAVPFRNDIVTCIRGKRNASPQRTEEQEHSQFKDCCDDYHKTNENEEKSRRSNDREGTAETRPARKEDGDDDDLRRRITANRRGTTEVMIRNIPSDWNWYDLKAYIIKHISFLSLYKSPSEEIGSVICKNKSVAMKLIEKIDDKPPYYLEAFLSSDDVEETEMNPDLEEGEREDSPYEYEDLRSKLNNRRIQDCGGYYAPDEDRRYSYEDKRYPRKRSPLRPGYHHIPYLVKNYSDVFNVDDYVSKPKNLIMFYLIEVSA